MDGQTLKEAREILGLSQVEMAAKIHVSFPTYNGYENGKNIPKNKHAILNAVLQEASLVEVENINDEVLKRDAKDILVDVLVELKEIRRENTELKQLIVQNIDLTKNEAKINELSSSQLNILKELVHNLNLQVEKIKKADIKSASGK